METKTTLIPVGGGKGGVGKSLTAANLAAALAGLGKRTILLDLDLGGSNLYSYLGLPNSNPGIGDYLMTKEGTLADYQVDTAYPGLSYIPGDGRTPFMANLSYAHKIKLAREIRRLEADYLIVDIGAGTSFNTIDYFSLAPLGMLLTTPDTPSLMNMLAFLKSFLLRNIIARIKHIPQTEKLIRTIQRQTVSSALLTVDMIRKRLQEISPLAAREADLIIQTYRPRVVFNLADEAEDILVARPVESAALKQLSLRIDWFGLLFHDSQVRRSVRQRKLLLRDQQDCLYAEGIRQLAQQVIDSWDRQSEMSFELLQASTHSFIQRRRSTQPTGF
ncbi:MAG: MinD/ParA family protein [Desulfuromonas sp.]|nr:MAG: MinD/ParA family protein [Desulfuromonas sp.]